MGKNYRTNPCGKCEHKICLNNCDLKNTWLNNMRNGIFHYNSKQVITK